MVSFLVCSDEGARLERALYTKPYGWKLYLINPCWLKPIFSLLPNTEKIGVKGNYKTTIHQPDQGEFHFRSL